MEIKDMRRETSPMKYEYLLIIGDEQLWLDFKNLLDRKEVTVKKSVVRMRLSNMFSTKRISTFKTVLDCITRPAERKSHCKDSIADINSLMNTMGTRFTKRKVKL